nr:MAG TPA: hypothetical protein [Caudoviricetes sp.]
MPTQRVPEFLLSAGCAFSALDSSAKGGIIVVHIFCMRRGNYEV